jgi:hypothetical protein
LTASPLAWTAPGSRYNLVASCRKLTVETEYLFLDFKLGLKRALSSRHQGILFNIEDSKNI